MQRSHPRSPYCLHRSPCCLAKVPESSIPRAFVKNAKELPSESLLSSPESSIPLSFVKMQRSPPRSLCCLAGVLNPTFLCKKYKGATAEVLNPTLHHFCNNHKPLLNKVINDSFISHDHDWWKTFGL